MQNTERLVGIIAMTVIVAAVLPHRANAAVSAPGTIGFTQANYDVHENQGYATLTIHRTDTSVEAWIRYGVRQASATNGSTSTWCPIRWLTLCPARPTIPSAYTSTTGG
jgi:hypothetical protein